MGERKHTFHALWWHLGPYGRQDVHLHPCFTKRCHWELVGEGHACGGPGTPHVCKHLTIGNNWSGKEHTGEPLVADTPRKKVSAP